MEQIKDSDLDLDLDFDDSICDDSYNVESFEDFYNDNIQSEYDEYIMRKYLKPCRNCFELVSKKFLKNELCNLCNNSELHKEKRGSSANSSSNLGFIDNLMNIWDK